MQPFLSRRIDGASRDAWAVRSGEGVGAGDAGEVEFCLVFAAGDGGVDDDLQVGVAVAEHVAVHGDVADIGVPDGLAVLAMGADRALAPQLREARVAVQGAGDQSGQARVVGVARTRGAGRRRSRARLPRRSRTRPARPGRGRGRPERGSATSPGCGRPGRCRKDPRAVPPKSGSTRPAASRRRTPRPGSGPGG
jgi:hypothetical protein